MIGNWLKLLTEEQEDRVLTTVMRPGGYDAPCLVGVVGNRMNMLTSGTMTVGKASRGTCLESLILRRPIESAFDNLCARFGTERVAAAIRGRILHNRLVRTLGASVQDPQVSTVGA